MKNNSVRSPNPPIKATSCETPPKPKEDYSDDFNNIFSKLLIAEIGIKTSELTEVECIKLIKQLDFLNKAIKNKFV